MSIRTQDQGAARGGAYPSRPTRRSSGDGAAVAEYGGGNGWDGGEVSREGGETRLARGLAWFSIGLGLAEVFAPEAVQRIAGIEDDHTALVRLMGVREIAAGIGIFSQRRPTGGVWSRVGGDAIDLAGLGMAFFSPTTNRARLTAATAAVVGVTALDVLCAQQLGRDPNETTESGEIRVREGCVVNRSREECYRFWHDFRNLPRFMRHLESVETTGDQRSRWVATGPAGSSVEWEAEVVEDRPNELIAWRSLEGADVDNQGYVRFADAPGGRGTVVEVEILYNPPGGVVGAGIARLFGEEPTQQVKDDLRRFKQVMEIGEVVVSDATVDGNGWSEQRPAQPLAEGEMQ
jgi:uncharacterized membrane protein